MAWSEAEFERAELECAVSGTWPRFVEVGAALQK
jgi:hypothetical protein